jgi:hypothetical protein
LDRLRPKFTGKVEASDGEAVVRAVTEAASSPTLRPVDPAKMSYRPRPLSSRVGPVIVPDTESEIPAHEVPRGKAAGSTPEPATEHAQVQWTLAKLGADMGLDVWVAKNDRNRDVNGNRFTDLKRLKNDLPLQFDEATNRTIELIDVLWLQKNTIIAAFEIESTTSIYSGILRLSDLIAMQPNLNIPLFIVAPDDRRDKVVAEVNRPTFSKLSPPMYQMCRYIAFSTLCKKLTQVGEFVRYLKPEILDELAESCGVEAP